MTSRSEQKHAYWLRHQKKIGLHHAPRSFLGPSPAFYKRVVEDVPDFAYVEDDYFELPTDYIYNPCHRPRTEIEPWEVLDFKIKTSKRGSIYEHEKAKAQRAKFLRQKHRNSMLRRIWVEETLAGRRPKWTPPLD